jgi:mevalonate kinase
MTGVGYAGGKTILLGEHSVVYGGPAIAAGIDRGARALATALDKGPSRLFIRGWGLSASETDDDNDLARAFRALLTAARSPGGLQGHCEVEVEASLPPGGGLGCSAAIGVAIARSLDTRAPEATVLDWTMAWERVFHGNPSGVDAALSARGGCFVFRKGAPLEPVRLRGPLYLCIGNTGAASSTKTMVEAVARLRERKPELVEQTFEAIRVLVNNARLAIEAGDRQALGRLMDLNQMLLSGLFVSTSEIERMCSAARAAGALGAKLTGAGGGGSVVALAPTLSVSDAILAAWKAEGFDGFLASVVPDARGRELENGRAP